MEEDLDAVEMQTFDTHRALTIEELREDIAFVREIMDANTDKMLSISVFDEPQRFAQYKGLVAHVADVLAYLESRFVLFPRHPKHD